MINTKTLCYDYKNAMSLEEIDLWYATTQFWWYSSGVASEGAIYELNNWLGF
jgi:hypothetical protein